MVLKEYVSCHFITKHTNYASKQSSRPAAAAQKLMANLHTELPSLTNYTSSVKNQGKFYASIQIKNKLNVKLQGKDQFVHDMYKAIRAFITNLTLRFFFFIPHKSHADRGYPK